MAFRGTRIWARISIVVGVVALPLSMALAIASGIPPQHGLYTAIVAGAVIAALGGSRVQVSGPTAAFVALLVPVSARFGVGGLLIATVMAGLLLVLMGVTGMGRLVEFVPFPVTTGFTAGVAVVIAPGQGYHRELPLILGELIKTSERGFGRGDASLHDTFEVVSEWNRLLVALDKLEVESEQEATAV